MFLKSFFSRFAFCLIILSSLFSFVSPTYADETGLVGAYSFSENTGKKVSDSSSLKNNGTVSQPAWTKNGKYGSALIFGKHTNRVVIPHSESLNLQKFTIQAWVKPTSFKTDWSTVVLKEQNNNLAYSLYTNGSRPYSHIFSNGGEREITSSRSLPTNTWSNIAVTYSGSQLKLYINGKLVSTTNYTGSIATSNLPLSIGGNQVWSNETFPGLIDEVRIYNRPLSVEEIVADMHTPIKTATQPTLTVSPTVAITPTRVPAPTSTPVPSPTPTIVVFPSPTPTVAVTVSPTPTIVMSPSPAPTQLPGEPGWAFEELFTGDPSAPSQTLLPKTFDYVVTHRSHPNNHTNFTSYQADHGVDCSPPSNQHSVTTSHETNHTVPDQSFFICRNHMMSSMGDVEGYSVTSFWPLQEFDFSNGGTLEFDVNITDNHPRSWYEILITPREELKVGAAEDWLPIDESYPKNRIVLAFGQLGGNSDRIIRVGGGQYPPDGWIKSASSAPWRGYFWNGNYSGGVDANDPALNDPAIRRKNRIKIEDNKITWSIQKQDGSFDDFATDVPGGIPFDKGLVIFKTHAYTPKKDNNHNKYTFHWDTIRFSGPVVGKYEVFETNKLAYLEGSGDVLAGSTTTQTINLPHIGANPILFGQVNSASRGEVALSINGGPEMIINPSVYSQNDCSTAGWESFRQAIDPSQLQVGDNTFKWTVRYPTCVTGGYPWLGFSIKSLEVQFNK